MRRQSSWLENHRTLQEEPETASTAFVLTSVERAPSPAAVDVDVALDLIQPTTTDNLPAESPIRVAPDSAEYIPLLP